MVTIKQAAAKALEFARDIYGEAAIQAARVDEVERDDSDWQLTVSWLQPRDIAELSAMERAISIQELLPPNRVYKRFVVNSESGEVKAMHIRRVE